MRLRHHCQLRTSRSRECDVGLARNTGRLHSVDFLKNGSHAANNKVACDLQQGRMRPTTRSHTTNHKLNSRSDIEKRNLRRLFGTSQKVEKSTEFWFPLVAFGRAATENGEMRPEKPSGFARGFAGFVHRIMVRLR